MLRCFLFSLFVWALMSGHVQGNKDEPVCPRRTQTLLRTWLSMQNMWSHPRISVSISRNCKTRHRRIRIIFHRPSTSLTSASLDSYEPRNHGYVCSDIFLDKIPAGLKSFATTSLLRDQDSHNSPGLVNGYRLTKEEYGKGVKNHLE